MAAVDAAEAGHQSATLALAMAKERLAAEEQELLLEKKKESWTQHGATATADPCRIVCNDRCNWS